jgi:hypothetical protein
VRRRTERSALALWKEGTPRRRALLVLGAVAALTGLAAAGFAVVRAWFGVTFSSDAYSYLVWAHQAVREDVYGHVRFDYTAPKPLEMLVATIGEVLGMPIALFGSWAVLTFVLAVAAAAALAGRVAGPWAALAAGVLAAAMPGLVRQGLAADSTVPYAACVVGAAAAGAGRPTASGLLGIGGLIRPETWGLAAISAVLGWRGGTPRDRALAVGAAVIPPVLWLGFDYLSTGDALYGSHALERFGVRPLPFSELPEIAERVISRDAGWPLFALAVVSLLVGLRRRPLDAAVVFPIAIALGLLLQIELEMVGIQSFYRYVVGLLLFAAAGAGIALGSIPGRFRLVGIGAGLVLSIAVVSGPLEWLYVSQKARGELAAELEADMGRVTREAASGGGLVATESSWQGALSLYSGIPRGRIVPATAVAASVDRDEVSVFLVRSRRSGQLRVLDGLRPNVRSRRWFLYVAR